jgi:hypothetical protein
VGGSFADHRASEEPPGWEIRSETRSPQPVLLVAAAFSRHSEALEWAAKQLQDQYGSVGLVSEVFSFHHTTYYQPTMGIELRKQLFAFRRLVHEDCLPEVKQHTIRLEKQLALRKEFPEVRPINIDPGLLTLGKFLLATTKDQAHRIYLGKGIYAEVTLRYQVGAFHPWPWTYADYREPSVQAYLLQARDYYRQRLHERAGDILESEITRGN